MRDIKEITFETISQLMKFMTHIEAEYFVAVIQLKHFMAFVSVNKLWKLLQKFVIQDTPFLSFLQNLIL